MFIELIGFIILNGYNMINAIILLKCISMYLMAAAMMLKHS